MDPDYQGAPDDTPHPYISGVVRRYRNSITNTFITKPVYSNQRDYKILVKIMRERNFDTIKKKDIVSIFYLSDFKNFQTSSVFETDGSFKQTCSVTSLLFLCFLYFSEDFQIVHVDNLHDLFKCSENLAIWILLMRTSN